MEGLGLLGLARWLRLSRQQQLPVRLGPMGAVAEGVARPSQDELDLSGLLTQLSHGLQRAVGGEELALRASQLQDEDVAARLACRKTMQWRVRTQSSSNGRGFSYHLAMKHAHHSHNNNNIK